MRPCFMSTQSQSKSAWANTSAEKLEGTVSQPPRVGRPSAQSCRRRFGRIVRRHYTLRVLRGAPASHSGQALSWNERGVVKCYLADVDSSPPPRPSYGGQASFYPAQLRMTWGRL